MNELFFELIRFSIGTQSALSRMPSAKEWQLLYDMSQKQSLIGICFAGVKKLCNFEEEYYAGMNEMLYLTWMGMAAKIQQRNEVVNRQCVELRKQLSEDGLRSCVLKGQGVAQLYGSLALLRQSGDIDLWVDAPKDKVVALARKYGGVKPVDYLHVDAQVFEDTDVELHYRPTYMRSLRHNKRLQEFCKKHKKFEKRNDLFVPSLKFDVVYQLSHIYRHLFGLGIGLRQLTDYFFALRNLNVDDSERGQLIEQLKYLGLYNFACAVMYVMCEVFNMEQSYMICPVDEKRGQMLLKQVMQTGNFGKMDMEQKNARISTFGTIRYKIAQWLEFVRYYPEETLSAPVWSVVRKINV